MHVTITGDYELGSNLAERQNAYGTTDPIECAAVDMGNDAQEFPVLADMENMRLLIEPVVRVLITGPREWKSWAYVDKAMNETEWWAARARAQKIQLVHGGAEGLDSMFARKTTDPGRPMWLEPELHEPVWYPAGQYNRLAGFERNQVMVDSGIDLALVFLQECTKTSCRKKRPHDTHGTSDCLERIKEAGLPYREYRRLAL